MRKDVVQPIHVEAIGLANVRFFAPPTGAREFPWASIDDLMASVSMDRRVRRAFRDDIDSSIWRLDTKIIETASGRTIIGQHCVAQGLIDAWMTVGRCSHDLLVAYIMASGRALTKLLGGSDDSDFLSYCRDAINASNAKRNDMA